MGEPPPVVPEGDRDSLSHGRVLLDYWDPEYEVGYQVVGDQEFVFSNRWGVLNCDDQELRAIDGLSRI
jgi:hypothetical protein